MKKETAFYAIIAISALLFSLSFLFSQYSAHQRLLLSERQFLLEKGRAVYDCMSEHYPEKKPDEKGVSIALKQGSCEQKFSQ